MARKSGLQRLGSTLGGGVIGWAITSLLDPVLVAHGVPPLSAELVGALTTFGGGFLGDRLASMERPRPVVKPSKQPRPKRYITDSNLHNWYHETMRRVVTVYNALPGHNQDLASAAKRLSFEHDRWERGEPDYVGFLSALRAARHVLSTEIATHHDDRSLMLALIAGLTALEALIYESLCARDSSTVQQLFDDVRGRDTGIDIGDVENALDSLRDQGLVSVTLATQQTPGGSTVALKAYSVRPVPMLKSEQRTST